jgi:thiamine biosynthesis lipoprotein
VQTRVGYQKLQVTESPPSVSKQQADLQLDLSAIAKGYAVDQLGELLEKRGIQDYLVEVGGELKAVGEKSEGRSWRVGIEQPDAKMPESSGGQRSVKQAIEIRDLAMATSGDYRNYYEKDGKRISHTIDARDGRPIRHNLASVSVLHASAMMADGYATALSVLGPDEGFALAEKLDLAVYVIVRSGDGFETRSTGRFSELSKTVNQ